MGIRIIVPDVLTGATERGAPATLTTPRHRVTFSQARIPTGGDITAVPTEVGNTVTVVQPPVLRADPFYYGAFRGTVNDQDDQIRLSATPAISMAGFTTIMIARLKTVQLGDGYTSLFYMMPPGGNRSDLTLWAPSGARVLRFTTGAGTNVDHGWTPDTQWHVFSVTQSGDSVAVGVDGQEAIVTGIDTLASNGFNIGQRRGGGFSAIDVADVAIFPYMALADRRAEMTNLADFYNIEMAA